MEGFVAAFSSPTVEPPKARRASTTREQCIVAQPIEMVRVGTSSGASEWIALSERVSIGMPAAGVPLLRFEKQPQSLAGQTEGPDGLEKRLLAEGGVGGGEPLLAAEPGPLAFRVLAG